MTAVPHSAGTHRPSIDVPAAARAIATCTSSIGASPRRRTGDATPPDAPVAAYRAAAATARHRACGDRQSFDVRHRQRVHARRVGGVRDRRRAASRSSQPTLPSAELASMAELGVVGVRVNFVSPQSWGTTTLDMLEDARRDAWRRMAGMSRCSCMRRRSSRRATCLPGFRFPSSSITWDAFRNRRASRIRHSLRSSDCSIPAGRGSSSRAPTWTRSQVRPTYADIDAARARLTSMRHPSAWSGGATGRIRRRRRPIDDAALVDLLMDWAPDPRTRRRILVENPEVLYGFA